ncbi:serine/threonine-protein kinase [Mycobacterium sp. Marseille-P9652]|uniref:serine/threonine-protein kinase n=1 Tax=Mycobacterium sp. Marseille-P9652 TaxID=2654950 RepID=UPI0012E8EC06|nr:serine/threonine-protein kinase [Mycobacterium sp. Marseille-P9652]
MNTTVLLGGRYELRGKLGRGGMAEVFDGWDTRLDRPVAIKLLHPALSGEPDVRNRFDAEARACASLNHPSIVAVYDSGEDNGTPFIVMERLPGATLADQIARGPLPQERVHAMLDSVLAALTAAHGAAILHRDIKPGNILLGADGESMKVADFGIAKTAGAAHTLTGQIVGTIAYLSPQRLAGAPASVADDLYAVGVVGYEALAGHRPFPQDNMAALASAIFHGRPIPLGHLRPDVDPALVGVIERAMAPDAGLRFTGAGEMLAALRGRGFAHPVGPPVAAPPRLATKFLPEPLPPPAPATPGVRHRHKVLAVLAVLATLILVPLALALDAATSHAPSGPGTTSTAVPTPVTSSAPMPAVSTSDQPPPPQQPPAGPAPHGPGKGKGKGRG